MTQDALVDIRQFVADGETDDALKALDDWLAVTPDDAEALRLKLDLCVELKQQYAFISRYLYHPDRIDDAELDDLRQWAQEEAYNLVRQGRRILNGTRGGHEDAPKIFARALLLHPTDEGLALIIAHNLINYRGGRRRRYDPEAEPAYPFSQLYSEHLQDGTKIDYRGEVVSFELEELANSDEDFLLKHIKPLADYCLSLAEARGAEAHLVAQRRINLYLIEGWFEHLLPLFDTLDTSKQQMMLKQVTVVLLQHAARLLGNGQIDDAMMVIEAARDITDDHIAVRQLQAEALILQKRWSEAQTLCEALIADAPEIWPQQLDAERVQAALATVDSLPIVCGFCGKTSQTTDDCVYCGTELQSLALFIKDYLPDQLNYQPLLQVMLAHIFEMCADDAAALHTAQQALDTALEDMVDADTVFRIRKIVIRLERQVDHWHLTARRIIEASVAGAIDQQLLQDLRQVSQQTPEVWQRIAYEQRVGLLDRLIAQEEIAAAHHFAAVAFVDEAQRPAQCKTLDEAVRALSVQLTEQAESELGAGNPETAIDIATEALRYDIVNLQARWIRGVAYTKTGQAAAAIPDLQLVAAERDHPMRLNALYSMLDVFEKQGNFHEAIALIEEHDDVAFDEDRTYQIERYLSGLPYIQMDERIDAVMQDSLRRTAVLPYWEGCFAMTVATVGRQNTDSGAWISTALDASYEFVRIVGGLANLAFESALAIRLISDPVAGVVEQGKLTIALIARVTATSEAECDRHARKLWKIINDSFPSFFKQHYQMQPVVSPEQLARLRDPFQYGTLAEIVRRDAQEETPQAPFTVYPFVLGEVTLRQVCRVLLSQDAPALLNIALVPTRLMGWERDLLDDIPLEDVAAAQNYQHMMGVSLDVVKSEQPHHRQAWEQVTVSRHLFASLRGQSYILRLTVAGAPETNPLLPEQIATVLLGATQVSSGGVRGGHQIIRANTSLERQAVACNLKRIDVEHWRDVFEQQNASRMPYLFGESEATIAFRLPIPGRDGLPGIRTIDAKPIPTPTQLPETGNVIGDSIYRVAGKTRVIRQSSEDRRRHTYVVGKTGTGKSTLLKLMALQDIRAGRGVCVIDPHGDLIEDILLRLPPERIDDVVLFDPSDDTRPIGLNLLQHRSEAEKHQIVSEFLAMLIRMYDPGQTGIVGPRFQHNVRNGMLTAMSLPNSTLIEVLRVLTDTKFVKQALPYVQDPIVRNYWLNQIASTSDFHKSEVLDYIVSKFNRFVGDRRVRHIVGQKQSSIDFRSIMDDGKILLVNLSKGRVGQENAQFLGLLLVQSLLIAALSRADMPVNERRDFYLYVDEFQNFATDLFTTILSEGRKYGVSLTVANQYLTQLTAEIRDAILGNVGSIMSFRLGIPDAGILSAEMQPTLSAYDLVNLPKYVIAAKLSIGGVIASPFTAMTRPDISPIDPQTAELCRQQSRIRYGRELNTVMDDIDQRFGNMMRR